MTYDPHTTGSTGRPTDRVDLDQPNTAGQRPVHPESRHETPAQSSVRVSGAGSGQHPSHGSSTSATTVGAAGVHHQPSAVPRTSGQRGDGRRGLTDTLSRLSPRDVAVLNLLADHRFLTTHHIQSFCFHDHASLASAARSTRRVLTRLQREQLLDRPARRVGGLYGGSEAHVWALTGPGQRLRALRTGIGSSPRVRTPGTRFIDHYLAIADIRLQLVTAERAGRLQISRVQIEPVCWQPFTGLGGSRETLKPDLAATTIPADDSNYLDAWYLEADRGTESIPTLLRQCRVYEACRASGVVQGKNGVFPIVVWIVPTERRADNLRRAIDHARGLDASLYRVCIYDQLVPLILGGAA